MGQHKVQNYYQNAKGQVLLERVSKHNDTGIQDQVLTKLIEQAQTDDHWEDVTVEQMLEELRSVYGSKIS